jgi:dihydrofolate reductase
MNVSLDGFFEGPGHDISSFHNEENPFEAYSPENGNEVDALLFGRKTYEMMKNYWPTLEAQKNAPEIARFMNEKDKYVASHTAFDPGWNKVTVLRDPAIEVKKLKEQPGKTIIILGSSNLCVTLMQAGLIDEFQMMLNPIVLGGGTSLFTGLPQKAGLSLKATHAYKSGTVQLTYAPAGK